MTLRVGHLYSYGDGVTDQAHEQCDACGFDGARYPDPALLEALQALGQRWSALMSTAGQQLRARPDPEVWSAIEYAAHSRDITALHVYGVEQALTVDEPAFPPVGDDLIGSAVASYAGLDADIVVTELATQASLLAELAGAAGSDSWSRGLTIGDERSDVRFLLEHALHDSVHHLGDVERGLAHLRQ